MDFQKKIGVGQRFGFNKSQRVGLSKCRPTSSANSDLHRCITNPNTYSIHRKALFKPSIESTPKSSATLKNNAAGIGLVPDDETPVDNESQISISQISPIERTVGLGLNTRRPSARLSLTQKTIFDVIPENPHNISTQRRTLSNQSSSCRSSPRVPRLSQIISAREALIRLSNTPQPYMEQRKMLSQDDSIFDEVDLDNVGEIHTGNCQSSASGESNSGDQVRPRPIPDFDFNAANSGKYFTGGCSAHEEDFIPESSHSKRRKFHVNIYEECESVPEINNDVGRAIPGGDDANFVPSTECQISPIGRSNINICRARLSLDQQTSYVAPEYQCSNTANENKLKNIDINCVGLPIDRLGLLDQNCIGTVKESGGAALIQLNHTPNNSMDQSQMLSLNESIFEGVELDDIGEINHNLNSISKTSGNCNQVTTGFTHTISLGEHCSEGGSSKEEDQISSLRKNVQFKLHEEFEPIPEGSNDRRGGSSSDSEIITIGLLQARPGTSSSKVNPMTTPVRPPSSLIPMGEKIRRALVTNAQKSITLKPQKALSLELGLDTSDAQSKAGSKPTCTDILVPEVKDMGTLSQFFDLGPFFGLPSRVKSLMQEYKGISELYPWQVECLNLPALRERKNLVYALPTSGGKTLVAEILIFRELLCCKKNVIFILPFVSIVQEKVRALSSFGLALNFLVEEYAASKGIYPPQKRRRKQTVFICTIEKALGLINSLIESKRLSEIGLVVVDELHLIGDSSGRGATLEGLLTKILFLPVPVQIVGMSATIGNLEEIATFLQAETYTQNFRPIELKEYVKLKNSIYIVNSSAGPEEGFPLHRHLQCNYTPKMLQLDPDMLAVLVKEVIPNNSCLVFCATKQNCENVALLLCRILSHKMLLEHKKKEKKSLCDSLRVEGNGSICPILSKTLPLGVAYHHAGLTGDERRLLEEAYLASIICCICCTSTLAAGVNLPAKRVIIRSPYIGLDFLNISRYKQMVGRAGRAGLGDSGESILLCTPTDAQRVGKLLLSKMDNATSSLLVENSQGMQNLVLSAIGLGIATNRDSLHHLATHTLLSVQAEKLNINIFKLTDDAITTLLKMNAIRTNSINPNCSILNNDVSICLSGGSGDESLRSPQAIANRYRLTQSKLNVDDNGKRVTVRRHTELIVNKLGRAAIKGGIELSRARMLYEDLRQAQRSLVCLSHLHLLYLVTPYNLCEQVKLVNATYFSALNELDTKDMLTARILGINEAAMTSLMRGNPIKGVPERVVRRFYVTLMLHDLWNQKSAWEVAVKFEMPRGFVQSLMSSSATFAACVIRFCEELDEMWVFKDLLGNFTQRLAYCCSLELLPLMELPAVKRGRAKQLYNAGYKSLKDVARADAGTLISAVAPLSKRVAFQIIAAAKLLLVEKLETLREKAEDVMEGFLDSKDIEEWMSGTTKGTHHHTQ